MTFFVDSDLDTVSKYGFFSNIYAFVEKRDGVGKVRNKMKSFGIKKKPGFGVVEIDFFYQDFVVGDKSHSQTRNIYSMLKQLSLG